MKNTLVVVAGQWPVEFPNDKRIPRNLRGVERSVCIKGNSLYVRAEKGRKEQELSGYALSYAARVGRALEAD